jgi:hypothetical protein
MWYQRSFTSSDWSDGSEHEEIEVMLGLPEGAIWNMKYTVEFGVSEHINATFHHEAEGGDISEAKIVGVEYIVKYVHGWNPDEYGFLTVTVSAEQFPLFEKYLPDSDKFYYGLIG